jgi:hypothetical protein
MEIGGDWAMKDLVEIWLLRFALAFELRRDRG